MLHVWLPGGGAGLAGGGVDPWPPLGAGVVADFFVAVADRGCDHGGGDGFGVPAHLGGGGSASVGLGGAGAGRDGGVARHRGVRDGGAAAGRGAFLWESPYAGDLRGEESGAVVDGSLPAAGAGDDGVDGVRRADGPDDGASLPRGDAVLRDGAGGRGGRGGLCGDGGAPGLCGVGDVSAGALGLVDFAGGVGIFRDLEFRDLSADGFRGDLSPDGDDGDAGRGGAEAGNNERLVDGVALPGVCGGDGGLHSLHGALLQTTGGEMKSARGRLH